MTISIINIIIITTLLWRALYFRTVILELKIYFLCVTLTNTKHLGVLNNNIKHTFTLILLFFFSPRAY